VGWLDAGRRADQAQWTQRQVLKRGVQQIAAGEVLSSRRARELLFLRYVYFLSGNSTRFMEVLYLMYPASDTHEAIAAHVGTNAPRRAQGGEAMHKHRLEG
jgi:hypothetical protein